MTSILNRPAVREAVLPISVEQYHRLGAAGIIDENTELLRGIIFRKTKRSNDIPFPPRMDTASNGFSNLIRVWRATRCPRSKLICANSSKPFSMR